MTIAQKIYQYARWIDGISIAVIVISIIVMARALSGTFMYVYLGYLEKAATGKASVGMWVLKVGGLLTVVAAMIYLTSKVKKALEDTVEIEKQASETVLPPLTPPTTWPWRVTMTTLLAVLSMSGAACTSFYNLFGPPQVTLQESYRENPDGQKFDHSLLDEVLRKHVDKDGWVDYEKLSKNSQKLDKYIETVGEATFAEMGRSEKLTLLINAYNAFTLRLILDYYPVSSIMDIPSAKRWDHVRWNVGGQTWSLNQIEHEQIRPNFKEPRIHFALVCAAKGCPKLRNEAYQASKIDEQLENQTRYVHNHDRWFQFESSSDVVKLTKLYKWYGTDFEQVSSSIVKYAARYSNALEKSLAQGKSPSISWLEYDWRLNDKKNRQ